MNTDPRRNKFCSFWKNHGKCEIEKHRGIKLVTTERRKHYFVQEPNYHTTKFFTENLSAREMKKQRYL